MFLFDITNLVRNITSSGFPWVIYNWFLEGQNQQRSVYSLRRSLMLCFLCHLHYFPKSEGLTLSHLIYLQLKWHFPAGPPLLTPQESSICDPILHYVSSNAEICRCVIVFMLHTVFFSLILGLRIKTYIIYNIWFTNYYCFNGKMSWTIFKEILKKLQS